MSLIVAARFEGFEAAQGAVQRLGLSGFPEWDIHTFYVNPAGEHGRYPFGGDRRSDPDSGRADMGAYLGAGGVGAVFAVVGGFVAAELSDSVAAILAAAGVGAYLGSLFGALWVTGHGTTQHGHFNPDAHAEVRKAGVMVAVRTRPQREMLACRILRDAGGADVEHANGHWRNNHWEDFDALSPPQREPGFG
ncbi:hypothetical protein [Achromobacter deleyi]|uniref:hypothetical protein n=1 Tax=Achromobacter deleyi TaxID=1353891 RepID=UPI001491B42B|nr:hypothetical protein [Achromobacter deleyi]QVQ25849.1 hypothetical protein HLG70_23755 [Achromobacter deleyi]UIP21388.1 hypothetical protein LYZ39_02420 [Achromobacter deleyi]